MFYDPYIDLFDGYDEYVDDLIKEAALAELEDELISEAIVDELIKEAARQELRLPVRPRDVGEKISDILYRLGLTIREHPLAATLGAAGVAPVMGTIGALTARAPETGMLTRLLRGAATAPRLRRGLLFSLLGLLPAAGVGAYAFGMGKPSFWERIRPYIPFM